MEPLVGIPEGAKILGISPWTLRYYLSQGKIRKIKVGRRTLIEAAELRLFVERCKANTAPAHGK